MTTLLQKSLARAVLLGDESFRVVLTPEGIRFTRKGRRKGIEVTWEGIMALGQSDDEPRQRPATHASDLPQAIAADVAREVRAANDALERASSALARAGSLPAALLADVEADPVYGRSEHHSDWFIEPLLTVAEVAALFRLSRSAVVRLPIPSVMIGSERRYRQSELRRYLVRQEGRG